MIGNTGNRPRTSTHHISHGAGSPHPPATTHSSTAAARLVAGTADASPITSQPAPRWRVIMPPHPLSPHAAMGQGRSLRGCAGAAHDAITIMTRSTAARFIATHHRTVAPGDIPERSLTRACPLSFTSSHKVRCPPTARVGVPGKVKNRGLRMSFHHFESEVGGARCLDRTCPPQFDSLRVEILEEPDTAAEKNGDQVDLHLVQQPGLQVLPHDVRSAPDADVLVAGGSTGQLECGLDPIRHEGVGRTT